MLASSVTHLSEPFIFPFSLPLVVATLYGISFLTIGIFLFRKGDRVLMWSSMHPITGWHLFVDLVVGPVCIHLIRRGQVSSLSSSIGPPE